MSIEAGVLIGPEDLVIHWHLPVERSIGYLPDSRELWDVIWANRNTVVGFAHSHPGFGVPGPSYEDVTTFSAVEMALGRRLVWWITSGDVCVAFEWKGPGKYSYEGIACPLEWEPEWLKGLRRESNY